MDALVCFDHCRGCGEPSREACRLMSVAAEGDRVTAFLSPPPDDLWWKLAAGVHF